MLLTALAAIILAATPDGGVVLTRPLDATAEHSSLENKEHRATYWGHVRVVRDATTLTCDRLTVFFDAAGEVDHLHATGDVAAVDGDRRAWGDEADYDYRRGVLVVRGNPRGRHGSREVTGTLVTFTTGTDALVVTQPHTVAPNERLGRGGPIVIDADTLTLIEAKSAATWRGHVKAKHGATVVTAPELDVTWDGAGAITRLVARGGVDIVEPTRRARGDRVDFDVVRDVMVVTGHPEAHQGKNHMRGSKVTFLPNTEFLEVENVVSVFEQEPKRR